VSNPLPFEPESDNTLRPRLKEAIAVPMEQLSYNPAQDRRHVFDHFLGLRVIITRNDDDQVHLSISIQPGGDLATDPMITSPTMLDIKVARCLVGIGGELFSESNRTNKFLSPTGIMHHDYRYDESLIP